jgi:hypothetical protein
MASFLIRIELEDVAPDHEIYTNLPSALANKNIYAVMHHQGSMTWYELPKATYFTNFYNSPGKQAQHVLTIVESVVNKCIDEFKSANHIVTIKANIVVAEATSLATTFPKTTPPQR